MMAPDELQGTILEHADRLQNYVQVKEKMVMLLDARCRLHDPNAMDGDTLVRTVIAGQSLAWKTRTLALLYGEIIAIDVEAWVTLQTIAALRRVKGREEKTKGMVEGLEGQAAKDGTRGRGQSGKGQTKGRRKAL